MLQIEADGAATHFYSRKDFYKICLTTGEDYKDILMQVSEPVLLFFFLMKNETKNQDWSEGLRLSGLNILNNRFKQLDDGRRKDKNVCWGWINYYGSISNAE